MVEEILQSMPSDDTKSIIVENMPDFNDAHQCKSINVLTDLRIESATMAEQMVHMAACFQELSASLDEHMKRVDEGMRDLKVIATKHENEITDLKYNCRCPENWERVWADLALLKKDYHKRLGCQKWDDRIYDCVKYALCIIIGAIIVFFMQGGHITS